jgi:serine/threonine-protein kinase
MSSVVPDPIGVIGHYNLLERLEPSGPGELFRARDTRRGRTVTVRLLPPGFAAGGAARASLLADIGSTKALSHPNITTVFDAGEDEGRVFVVFEHLMGQSLRAEMAGRPMNVRRAVELATQIADAIAEAHAAGFIHGGLSPDSVTITARGHAKIPAFELAARAGFEDTHDGARLRDYDSPEEAKGQAADDRSDIHSVGAVLYEMLTTKRPSHKGAAAPSASNAHVPKELDDIVLRAVAPNPDLRFQSAVTLAAELRSLAAILDVRGAATDDEPAEEPAAGGTAVIVLAALVLAALAGLGWWLFP